MHKQLHILIVLLLTSTVTFAQVPNASFESWTDSIPDSWNCNDFPPVLYPVTRTTDAHSGIYAAKGEVVDYNGGAVPPNLYPLSTNGYGFPINQRYVSFYFWYKSILIGTDITTVSIVIYHSSGLSIGYAFSYLPAAANYTQFSIPIHYTASVPASYALITYSMADSTSLGFHIGSNFIVDDLSLSMVASVNPIEKPTFSIYPNPVNDLINVQGNFKTDEPIMVSVISSTGQMVLTKSVRTSTSGLPPIDVSTVPEGYYLIVLSDSKKSSSQRILISR